jgi:Zn-dependent protease with chaperone function
MKVVPKDYIHPEDLAALENLKAIPLFSACLKSFLNIGVERLIQGLSMANKIRLGPDQLPEIFEHLPRICQSLGIDEPELYLAMDPTPNAFTQGDTRTMITVTSGLIELLEEDEICAVVAHECGHIACRHVLYHTMAQMLAKYGAAIFGPVAALSMPVQLGLFYWARRSELSADRAAALFMRGSSSVVETMIRLAGGPKSITGKVNVDLYLQQAEAYDKLQESHWDKFLQGIAVMNMDHPFLSVRAREITYWCRGEHFQRMVDGMAQAAGQECASCGAAVGVDWKFCKSCGHALRPGAPANPDQKEALP